MTKTFLTARNGPKRSLLSTFNKSHEAPKQSIVTLARRPSPDVFDSPLSSDDSDDPQRLPLLDVSAAAPPDPITITRPAPNPNGARRTKGRIITDKATRQNAPWSSKPAKAEASSSPKRAREELDPAEDQLKDEYGFIGSSQSRKRARPMKDYTRLGDAGTSARGANNSPRKSYGSQKDQPGKQKKAASGFRTPPSEQELEEKLSKGRGMSRKSTFKAPPVISSPVQDIEAPAFKMPSQLLSPESSVPQVDGSLRRSSRNQQPDKTQSTGFLDDIIRVEYKPNRATVNPNPQGLSTSTDSMPPRLSDSSDTSSLSSPPGSPVSSSLGESLRISSSASSPKFVGPRCPMCAAPITQEFLENFDGGGRMNVRKQARFCRAHKVRSARSTWEERGYPDIDWERLPGRLRQDEYQDFLRGVLMGERKSWFRDRLEERIRTGRERTLRQSMANAGLEGLTPGYYGTRGARIMMDSIMSAFSAQIRRLAATDKTISTGGVTGFVQTVLVPELAVMLVREDMHLNDDERARTMLRESVDVGELLNEEKDEGDEGVGTSRVETDEL
ncbi:MAG: hypothetical protein M1817_005049 [Caeruleum heppii]|nr:MAG: hypothetical protein M1817_005049 [Caeruleum heppii]